MARVGSVPAGGWRPPEVLPAARGDLGLLVIERLITREVVIAGSSCAELVGEGELLRPWDDVGDVASVSSDVEWQVVTEARLALIDRQLLALASAWPEVTTALVVRAVTRAQLLAVAMAITCVTGLKMRLLVLM